MTTQKKVGRRSKLNKELINKLSQLLAQGSTIKDACASVGISQSLYFEWMSWATYIATGGKQGKQKTKKVSNALLMEFMESVERAKSSSYIISVNEIRRAGSPYWRHTITGKIVYKEPPPVVWMNKLTGEIRFTEPEDSHDYEKQFSGEAWEYKEGKWQAQAWYLERSDRATWGANLDLSGSIEPVEIIINKVNGNN